MNTWPNDPSQYNMMNMPNMPMNMMPTNPMQGNMPVMNDWNQMNPMMNNANMTNNGGTFVPPLPIDNKEMDAGNNQNEGQGPQGGGNRRGSKRNLDDRSRGGRSTERNRDRNDRGDRSRSDRRDRRTKWGDVETHNQVPNNMMMGNMGQGNPVMGPGNNMGQGNMMPYSNMMDMQQMPNMNTMPNMPINPMMPGMSMMPNMMDQNQMMMVQMQMMGQQAPMPLSPIYISNGVLLPPVPGSMPPARREKPPGCRTIFIGGIPKTITKEIITEIFQRFGPISDVQLHRQGISHVRFEKHETVEQSFFLSGYRYKLHDQTEHEATTIFIDYALVSFDYNFETSQPMESFKSPDLANEVPEKKRTRRTGAFRKKLRKLMETGMSYYDAVDLLESDQSELQNSPSQSKATKRSLDEESPGPSKPNKIQKLQQEPPINHSLKNHSLKIGIHNRNPMTYDQMSLIHRAIIVAMTTTADELKVGEGPKFKSFIHKSGWILVSCEDQYSLDWLINEVPKLKPWPEAHLTVMRDPPKDIVGSLFIPKSEVQTVEEALTLIRLQNHGLDTELWRVINVQSKEHGIVAVFSLDELSVEVLRVTNYTVCLGFKPLTLRIKSDNHSEAITSKKLTVGSVSKLGKNEQPSLKSNKAKTIAKVPQSSINPSSQSLQPKNPKKSKKGRKGVRSSSEPTHNKPPFEHGN